MKPLLLYPSMAHVLEDENLKMELRIRLDNVLGTIEDGMYASMLELLSDLIKEFMKDKLFVTFLMANNIIRLYCSDSAFASRKGYMGIHLMEHRDHFSARYEPKED